MTRKPPEGSISAGELTKKLNADPEWVARRRARDAELEATSARRKAAAAGLELELKAAGIEMASFRYLKQKPANYKLGIPILIRHMQMDQYDDPERNSMAQAIAMKETNPYWDELLALFLSAVRDERHFCFRQGLAVALAASHKAPQFERLLSLCENTDFGSTRLLLVEALKRSKDPRAEITLMKSAPTLCSASRSARGWRSARSAATSKVAIISLPSIRAGTPRCHAPEKIMISAGASGP